MGKGKKRGQEEAVGKPDGKQHGQQHGAKPPKQQKQQHQQQQQPAQQQQQQSGKGGKAAKVKGPPNAAALAAALTGNQHYMCHLQVLSSDVPHNSPSLMLVLDKGGRFLFNAGEGLQRLIREKKVRMTKLDHYFFTRVHSETMAGLAGMLLSTGTTDAGGLLKGQDVCSIIGPRGVAAYTAAFQDYTNLEQRLKLVELSASSTDTSSQQDGQGGEEQRAAADGVATGAPGAEAVSASGSRFKVSKPVVDNPYMTVVPVALAPAPTAAPAAKQDAPMADPELPAAATSSEPDSSTTVPSTSGRHSDTAQRFGPTPSPWSPPDEVVCYVCDMKGLPGKFDSKRADELDVPRGPERKELQRGEPVTLLTGRVVHPHEVMNPPSVPGPCVVVVDCPSHAHMDTLTSEPGPLSKWTDAAKAEATAASSSPAPGALGPRPVKHLVMAHFTPPELVASARYQSWMQGLGPGWNHIMCCSGRGQKTTLIRASALQAKLNCLHPSLFPLLHVPWAPGTEAQTTLPNAFVPSKLAPAQPAAQQPTEAAAPTAPAAAGDASASKMDVDKEDVDMAPAAAVEHGSGSNGSSATADLQEAAAAAASAVATATAAAAAPAGASGGEATAAVAVFAAASAAAAPMVIPPGSVCVAPNGFRYHVLPVRVQGGDCAEVEECASAGEVQQQFASVAGEVVQIAREAVSSAPADTQPEVLSRIGRDELEFVFLGTVSSVPSKFRNVTSIYLDRFHRGGMLLDCGEDTLGQLKRRYGAAGCERRVRELACIWVSHMHADHHGGLARLLQLRDRLLTEDQGADGRRDQGTTGTGISGDQQQAGSNGSAASARPLLIIGPEKLFGVLLKYREVLRMPLHFLGNQCLDPAFDGRPPPPFILQRYRQVLSQLQLRALAPFPVQHVGRAYGIRVEGEAGWKLIFSGDTRPCQSLIQAAKNATVLIHEATFEDDKAEEARAKHHSTTGEAMEVATQANAYRTILTHFSSRYPTMPAFDWSTRHDVAIAMDFMTVNLCDLPWLPGMVRPLDELFKREAAGWEADDADGAAAAAPAGGGVAAAAAAVAPVAGVTAAVDAVHVVSAEVGKQ